MVQYAIFVLQAHGPEEMALNTKRLIALALVCALAFATPVLAAASNSRRVISVALKQLGKPYALKSDAPNSFNCASFVAYCVNQVSGGRISKEGIDGTHHRVTAFKNLRQGDVVCFRTSGTEIGILNYHFGLYMGRGYFIHASNSAGKVIISKLKDYEGRFLGAMRIL